MEQEQVLHLYNINDAVGILRISGERIRQLVRQGKLNHRRLGKRIFFTAANLNTYMGGEGK